MRNDINLKRALALPIALLLALSLAACGGDDSSDGGGGDGCDFGEVFTTDGRIEGLDLVLVEDPGVMIIYNVSLTVRGDSYDQNPDAWDAVADGILGGLDQDTMNALNRQVSFDGEAPDEVGIAYLEDQGLVADGEAVGDLEGVDFDGQSITVGSKDFDEQLLLGQIIVQTLEAAGAEVTDSTNTGGTQVAREALLNGDVDVYPEYNGTGWTEHLGNEDPSDDPTELYEAVRDQDLEENDIHWLGSSEFNNTYGFATSQAFVDENNNGEPFTFDTMAAFLEENSSSTVCMESEFPDRTDGLVLWEEATGFEIPESQITILDTNVIYTETAS